MLEVDVTEPGYLFTHLSHDEPENVDVYFDDFTVIHEHGHIVQAQDFYPFGLAFNAKLQEHAVLNNYLYQGKERFDSLGWDDFHARLYSPALGRFLGADPAGQFASPYNAMGNNPVMMVDPDGELAWFVPIIIGAVMNVGINAAQGNIDNFWDGLGYAVVGGAAGALGGGLASGISSAIGGTGFGAGFSAAFSGSTGLAGSGLTAATSSFFTGAAIGGGAGFGAGFVSGLGNGLVGDESFGNALGLGLKDGLIGGVTGGVIGGVAGGIDAVKDGRRFFDGATVQETIVDRQLPYVRQSSDYNCGAACVESYTNGNVNQNQVRNAVAPGTNPNTQGMSDIRVMQELQKQTGRPINILQNRSVSNIYNEFANGKDFNISLRLSNTNIGHSVNLNRATHRVITKVSGKVIHRYLFDVMNPAANGGQYFRISNSDILNAYRIFKIGF